MIVIALCSAWVAIAKIRDWVLWYTKANARPRMNVTGRMPTPKPGKCMSAKTADEISMAVVAPSLDARPGIAKPRKTTSSPMGARTATVMIVSGSPAVSSMSVALSGTLIHSGTSRKSTPSYHMVTATYAAAYIPMAIA